MAETILSKQKAEKILSPLPKKWLEESRGAFPKVILLAGPTGCGKSALSLLLAELLGGEIVSADSVQVYQGMDIGTAKVSKEERARIPHYLIDTRRVQESFNIVDFYYEAKQCCNAIAARGRVPIVVGGSGFYFRALLHGPPSGPPAVHEVRLELEEKLKEFGTAELYRRLEELDPLYAKTITPNDQQKLVRALEIITVTGERVSDLKWDCNRLVKDFSFHAWFLHRPRPVLYKRLDGRCEQMLELGLVDEVRALDKQGLRSNRSAAQAIGYRQVLDYLDSPQSLEDYHRMVHEFKVATRHYVKKQFTWFRKEPLFRWLDVELHDPEIAIDLIAQEYRG